MKRTFFSLWSLFFLHSTFVLAEPPVRESIQRSVEHYNLQEGLGLKGYDPVSVFEEGGAEPRIGDAKINTTYLGVSYWFSSQANRDLFLASPDKYEPTYGGWCAYAMSFGSKVDINPEIYTIRENRVHYFVSKRAKQNFDADPSQFESNADKNWKIISGEDPRS